MKIPCTLHGVKDKSLKFHIYIKRYFTLNSQQCDRLLEMRVVGPEIKGHTVLKAANVGMFR